ncbi:MAG: methyltransferase domain-containing protein [Campylobacterales bacterium]|nr:methyltransferase domain-containing protein [Campylobacterales bacterium]
MIEINIPNLTSKEIMQKIEREVEKIDLAPSQTLPTESMSKTLQQTNVRANSSYGFAKKVGKFLQKKGLGTFVKYIQKTFKLYPQNRIHVISDFTKFYDENFINNAYNLIFYREADTNEKNHYLSLLRSGKLSKTEIITSLYFSKEGKEQNLIILGIKKRYAIALLYKIPFLGYIAKMLFTLVTLPKLIVRLNSYENQLQTKSSNETVSNLAKHLEWMIETKSSNETVSNLAKYLESELQTKSSNETLSNLEKYLELMLETKSSNETLSNLAIHLESELQTKASNETLSNLSKHLESELQTKAEINQFELYLQTVNHAKKYMKLTEQTMQNLIDEAKKRLPDAVFNQKELKLITDEERYKFDNFYIEFEDKFRGDRAEIKKRVKVYLPYIRNLPFKKEDIKSLDVGCGRGEWLELLEENGYTDARGIDLNRAMVAKSKEFGLDVKEADVIEYLSNQKDESLSFITGFHIIEHLPFEVLMRLFQESYRVLQKGGMVIFETPNPENIAVGACNFYTDPTHQNPIPPITGEFLLQQNSFTNTSILRLNLLKEAKYIEDSSFSDVNDILFALTKEQDYAIIGYKK